MNVWKSPVLYFGIALALAVLILLVAPFLINWNGYKPQLEAYGRQLTGRPVTIAGDVDARLFPWPRLTASNIVIGNDPGFGDAPLLAADAMTTRFSLAGLFSATLQVEDIEFAAPQLNLVRSDKGEMNWSLHPAESLQGLLARVKLDRITIRDGGIWLEDKQRRKSASLTGVNATLSALALEGPWRLVGTGQWRDTALNLSLSTGAYSPSEGINVTLSASPEDVELPVLSVSGRWKDGEMEGALRLSGQEGGTGKGSIQDKLRPLALQSDFSFTEHAVRFTAIRIAPTDKRDGGTLIEGHATVDLAAQTRAEIVLKAPRINLDSVLGAGSMARWRNGGLLAVANSVFTELPDDARARFSLDVSVLTAGGESLNDVNLTGTAERVAIRINNASAQLPGRSRARFDGVVFPASHGAELGGTLALESNDLRALAGWLLPAARGPLAEHWRGTRGRLKLQSDVSWAPQRLFIEDADYELDARPGKLSLEFLPGEVPRLAVNAEMQDFDLDSYLREPDAPAEAASPLAALDLLPSALELGQLAEHHITLAARHMTLNGTSAQGVAIDYVSGLSGLEIKSLDVASAGGARLKGQGLVINGTDGPVGEIDLALNAGDVTAFLRFAGLVPKAGPAAWHKLLGETESNFTIGVDAEAGRPRLTVKGAGTSGRLHLEADLTLRDPGSTEGRSLSGKLRARSSDATPFLHELGVVEAAAGTPLELAAEFSSTRHTSFAARFSAKALGADLTFEGTLDPAAPFAALDGRLAVKAADTQPWVSAFGLPLPPPGPGGLAWTGTVAPAGQGLAIEQEQGEAWGGAFALSATLDDGWVAAVDVETGSVSLQQLLAWTLLSWRGGETDLNNSFAAGLPLFTEAQIYVRPRSLTTGIGRTLREAVIGIGLSAANREMSIKVPGNAVDITISAKSEGDSTRLAAKGRFTVELAQALRLEQGDAAATGTVVIDGEASGRGRSPAAALRAMEGKGLFWLEGASLGRITVNGFARAIANATSPAALTAALAALEGAAGTPVPSQTGAVSLLSGVATTAPIVMHNTEESMTIRTQLDLAALELAVQSDVTSGLRRDLPSVTFTYSGPPGALRLRKGSAALAARLGYELMSQELAKLEKLQQEEQALLRREQEQRLQDQQRFEAYQQQRAELRQRQRELRFHAEERKRLAAESQRALQKAVAEGDAVNRQELSQRLREIAIRRTLNAPLLQP
jgi:hypothetical protein